MTAKNNTPVSPSEKEKMPPVSVEHDELEQRMKIIVQQYEFHANKEREHHDLKCRAEGYLKALQELTTPRPEKEAAPDAN